MIASRVLKTGWKMAALAGAGLALSGQASPEQNAANLAKVERTDASHIIGDPAAPVKFTEWVSYTCPACGNFARSGEEVIKIAYVDPGKVKVEVRYLQRSPVDVALTLAAWCGGPDKFLLNHSTIMYRQADWLPKYQKATAAQQNRWLSGPQAQRRKAIASDLDLYSVMESRGLGRAELDRCLADDTLAPTLEAASSADSSKLKINSTPSFAIDDTVLHEAHGWPHIAPLLSQATMPKTVTYGPN